MLRKLNVAAPPALPTLASSSSIAAAETVSPAAEAAVTSTLRSALAKVCSVENLIVRNRVKRPKGPSLYVIELFFTRPGHPSAMLAPTWKIGADMGAREPDATRHKPFNEAFECHDAVAAMVNKCAFGGRTKCRLCKSLHTYIEDNYTAPHQLNRAFIGTTRKCLLVEEVLAKFVYLIVRAQRPARPMMPYAPNCEHQSEIAELVAAFLEL